MAGVQVIAGFDHWELAGRNFLDSFLDSKFFLGRLEDLDIHRVARIVGAVDLIIASPECTNHSPAKGNKPRCEISKATAFQVIRFAQHFKPRWIVVENVVSMRRWARYPEFKLDLEGLGYKIREQVLNAADFGVPQGRRRLFLMCDQVREPDLVLPVSSVRSSVASILEMNGRYSWSPLRTPRRATATLERARRAIEGVGEDNPFLIVYYGSDHAGGWQVISRPLRTITTLDRFAIVKPSGGGHVMRMLQVPELQRAMGMSGMCFEHGTRRERIKMIGNAVCPPVMKAVIEQLKAK